jgi:hypothetical protein
MGDALRSARDDGSHDNRPMEERVVRLEPLSRMSMRYTNASWHRPYGSDGGDEEGLGFGHGDGVVTGEIEGKFVWANYPRRRQDGVWTPNLRGDARSSRASS